MSDGFSQLERREEFWVEANVGLLEKSIGSVWSGFETGSEEVVFDGEQLENDPISLPLFSLQNIKLLVEEYNLKLELTMNLERPVL